MLPSNFFNRLDPIYCEAILQLDQKIDEIESIEAINDSEVEESDLKINNLLDEFSSKFLMPRKLWKKKTELARYSNVNIGRYHLAAECIFHLSYLTMEDRKFLGIPYLHDKKLYYCEDRKILPSLECELSVDNFCFPHANLEDKWKDYEFKTRKLIPRPVCKKYDKMKKLYLKIKMVKNDIEKWFDALKEAGDFEFVVQNVEFRLGQCLTNKQLWKLYIAFLEKHDDYQKLLETYSKYCRFFISDHEMKENYQKAAEKHGPSVVPWKNTFDFEVYNKLKLSPPKSTVLPEPSSPSKFIYHFNPQTVSPQHFPFRSTLIDYMVKTASASLLHDLFQTCKWFYLKYPIAVVYHYFGTGWDITRFTGQKITTDTLGYPKMNSKLYFSNIFTFKFHKPNVRALSDMIATKIHRCSASRIYISQQNLSLSEVEFLIGHGEVTDLYLSVKNQDGNSFVFEDILQFIPKIQELDLLYTIISPNIAETLCNFPFKNKLQLFRIGDVRTLPDPNTFAEFILKHSQKNYPSRFEFFGYNIEYPQNQEKRKNIIRFENQVDLLVYEKWKGYILPELKI